MIICSSVPKLLYAYSKTLILTNALQGCDYAKEETFHGNACILIMYIVISNTECRLVLFVGRCFSHFFQGAGHNDVELYSQYLERLKQFVSVELLN
jgi:hypothetical protein